uniref:Uncharacterized protein n=1 Tax=Ditylenchus dipsaci TaxID=166011 RepID=A0A915DZF4_9BILA
MAIYQTLKNCAEAKRQRQRRHLFETAIQRVIIHQREHISAAAAGNMSIFSASAQIADSIFGKLPSYDEALRMGQISAERKQERRSNSR